jgi:hypothetical protein
MNLDSIKLNKTSDALPEIVIFKNSEVSSITLRSSVLTGFNEMGKNYSVTQPIFIKSENGIKYENAGNIKIGDVIISVDLEGVISEIEVISIQVDDLESTVYDIRTNPEPWFIVNSTIAIA